MFNPRQLQIRSFTYNLPEDKVAKYPLPERDLSKLLVYRYGKITEDVYRNIDQYIPVNSLLIFNNTKVIQARLFFQTSVGTKVEIFCLEPSEANAEMFSVMNSKKSSRWNCMIGRYSKWSGKILEHRTKDFALKAEIVERNNDSFVVEFEWKPEEMTFAEILDKTGVIPIPPYLKRESEEMDVSRYQTLYAKNQGSVAAPTAGLHFTEEIFEKLKTKSIGVEEVTLHVGAGTFRPVKSETMQDHEMHAELIDVKVETIQNLLQAVEEEDKRRIIAVGTTSLRTIESLYWMGVKAKLRPEILLDELEIKQWDVYENTFQVSVPGNVRDALEALLSWMKKNGLKRLICKTQILIAPYYELKIAGALVTNFHQPNSTLLLLVAAVAGEQWRQIYNYALDNNFRFLSYGDGSLIFRE